MLQGALMQFLGDVDWGELDYLVLDLPPGTGDVALTLAQRLRRTGAVIVTTPQEVALQDVYKSVSMCKKLNIPMLGVIENMSYFIDTRRRAPRALRHRRRPEDRRVRARRRCSGRSRCTPPVREWGDAGTPVVQAAPEPPGRAGLHATSPSALAERIALELLRCAAAARRRPTARAEAPLKIMR